MALVDTVKVLADHPAIDALAVLILILAGAHHMIAPAASMVGTWLSFLPDIVVRAIGLLVAVNGLVKAPAILGR